MFEVKSKLKLYEHDSFYKVYSVINENGNIKFLFYDELLGWHYELAEKFIPVI